MSDLRRTRPSSDETTVVDHGHVRDAIKAHVHAARAHAAEGAHARAFTELLKALRLGQPTAALARETLVAARRAGLELAAAAALEEASANARPTDTAVYQRMLARLFRRQGRLEQARLQLYQLLAQSPGALPSLIALAHLLAREGRTHELAQVLQRVAARCAAAGKHGWALRAQLARGRILGVLLGDHPAAADAFSAAAAAGLQGGAVEPAYSAQLLALQSLSRAGGSPEELAALEGQLGRIASRAGVAREAERARTIFARGKGPEVAQLLIERAVLAEARASQTEAVALWEAALLANPSARDAAERLARLLSVRKAWSELAEFRGRQAERAPDAATRAEALTQRALILERHLGDLGAAAAAYGEVFRTTGDPAALLAQLDRLERAGGAAAAESALDRAVSVAPDLARKAAALRVRAERLLALRRYDLAAADLQRLAQLEPLGPEAERWLLEARAEEGEPQAILALWELAAGLEPNAPGRAEVYRRLARLCAWPLGDAERSRRAWTEVLRERPDDAEAEERLLQLARAHDRPQELLPILQARAARLSRGPAARQARHDLARLHERLGDAEAALAAWQAAVRAEPSDAEAQLALGERLEARGDLELAAQAFEGAAQGLDDPRARGATWARLALLRHRLGHAETAQHAVERARSLGVQVALPDPAPLPGRRTRTETRRKRARSDPAKVPLSRSAPAELLLGLQREPLEARLHHRLAEHFDRAGDVLRASLFTEVARAIEGDPDAEPLAPRATLSATGRLALRHPLLKGAWLEALQLCGAALVAEASPARRSLAAFTMDAGKGAAGAAQSLFDAVRILGQRAPDVVVATQDGPPFALEPGDPVRLTVGRAALRKPMPASELRFFAGRALYALAPDLMALRLLEVDVLAAQMQQVVDAVLGAKGKKEPRFKAAAARLSPKARERLGQLMDSLRVVRPDWAQLMLAARHSANRAGLLAAGGVAPALRAMQLKRADTDELAELVRFAVSDRMVRIRSHRR